MQNARFFSVGMISFFQRLFFFCSFLLFILQDQDVGNVSDLNLNLFEVHTCLGPIIEIPSSREMFVSETSGLLLFFFP